MTTRVRYEPSDNIVRYTLSPSSNGLTTSPCVWMFERTAPGGSVGPGACASRLWTVMSMVSPGCTWSVGAGNCAGYVVPSGVVYW